MPGPSSQALASREEVGELLWGESDRALPGDSNARPQPGRRAPGIAGPTLTVPGAQAARRLRKSTQGELGRSWLGRRGKCKEGKIRHPPVLGAVTPEAGQTLEDESSQKLENDSRNGQVIRGAGDKAEEIPQKEHRG